jgi:hypothetical protein
MNRGPTLLHYDFRVVTYDSTTKTQAQFTIRAYLKNGKRWRNFPFLANQTRMVVSGKVCGITSNDRHLAVLVDNFNFLSGSEIPLSSSLQSSPQTPLSTKRTIRDLWDRTDVDGLSGSPPKKRRLPSDSQDSHVEIPETPCPSSAPIDLEESSEDVERREKESAVQESRKMKYTAFAISRLTSYPLCTSKFHIKCHQHLYTRNALRKQ